MSVATVAVQQATIRQYAKDLKLATVSGQFLSMAEEAVKQKQGHLSYLEARCSERKWKIAISTE